jgi:hypothetical protein
MEAKGTDTLDEALADYLPEGGTIVTQEASRTGTRAT